MLSIVANYENSRGINFPKVSEEHCLLNQNFDRYFEVVKADTDALRREVYHLRYDVYCDELGLEDKNEFPDELEKDIYDARSLHCLVRHKESGLAAGCVRLIKNVPGDDQLLPFEVAAADQINPEFRTALLRRTDFAEVSRLAVHPVFRRRTKDMNNKLGVNPFTDIGQMKGGERAYPLVAMGLYIVSSALAITEDLDRVYVMIEPRLARMLNRCGMRFTQISQIMDYHGQRAVYTIRPVDMLRSISLEGRDFLEKVCDRIA